MTPDEILEALANYTGQLPTEAMLAAMEAREAITPRLLEMLDTVLEDPDAWADRETAGEHISALFLLAQFRETRALPKVLDLLALPQAQMDLILGDLVTEGMSSILASLAGKEPTALESLATDSTRDPYVRGAAMDAILVLGFTGEIPEAHLLEIFDRLLRIFESRGDQEDAAAWACLFSACITGGFTSLEPRLQEAYRQGRVSSEIVEEVELADIGRVPNAHWRRRFLLDAHLVEDALLELEARAWLLIPEVDEDDDEDDDDEEEEDYEDEEEDDGEPVEDVAPEITRTVVQRQGPRPGETARNAPCPCGSGLKYKRCCGKDK